MGIRPLFRVGKEQATQLFRFVTQVDIRSVNDLTHTWGQGAGGAFWVYVCTFTILGMGRVVGIW